MSSTILHSSGPTPGQPAGLTLALDEEGDAATASGVAHPGARKNPFLVLLGERVRTLRSARGMTRKALSVAAGVSERHLANLEYGLGNASALVLLQVAQALHCSLAELLGDTTTLSPEWLLIREMLEQADEATLRRVREAVGDLLGTGGTHGRGASPRSARVALIGLRGAGKTTLGSLLAEDLGFPLVELSRQIEQFAGCSINEIQNLYGQSAYRRYERRALEEAIQIYPEAVITTPGGLVSDAATFNTLLAHCNTVWLQADPQDHLKRVAAQGDMRPMAGHREALVDLKAILAGRSAFYAKAELRVDTSVGSVESAFAELRAGVRRLLALPLE